MEFQLTEQQKSLRTDVRTFLAQNVPDDWVPRAFIFQSEDEWAQAREFDAKVALRQWLAPSWPVESGGLGFNPLSQCILDQEFALAGAPDGGARGHGPHFVGPAILRFGTPEQRERFIPGIVDGTEIWAQCFSEDQAGSDMANVKTTAVRDGDEYVLNGVKLWTGQGHRAKYAIVTALTSDGPKHRSISLFMLDLHSEGVAIKPIWTLPRFGRLNMEIFDNVRVPVANRLGEENEAWRIMVDVMNHERSSVAGPANARRVLNGLVSDIKTGRLVLARESRAVLRHHVAELATAIEISFLLNYRIAWMTTRGDHPSHEASVVKLLGATIVQSMANVMMSAYGLNSILPHDARHGVHEGEVGDFWLQSVQASIVSGSSEIMRNVIATRGLGLPRS